jgi:hypothetical protein
MNDENQNNTNLVQQGGVSIEQMLERVDLKLNVVSEFKKKALKYLKPEDVIDQGGTPYVMESGSIGIIAKGFELHITNLVRHDPVTIKYEDEPDEMIFNYTADVSSPGLGSIQAQGTCSTRDDLLGKAHGKYKDLKDVNKPSVMNKAMTNLQNNAVKHFVGLSNVTWEEIEDAAGFGKEDCKKVDRFGKQKKELSKKGEEVLQKVKDMAKEVFQGNKEDAKRWYKETTTYTLRSGKDKGKVIPGKDDPSTWSEDQLMKIIYPRIKEKYESMKNAEAGE